MPRRIGSVGAGLAALTLVLSAPALAHLQVEPPSIEVGGKQRFLLTVHNDREETMTAFRLVAPASSLQILGTGGASGWNEVVEGATATWSGGTLAPDTPATFEVDLEAIAQEPGPAELEGVQLYAGGESVSWPFTLTVLPVGGSVEEDGGGLGSSAVVVLGAGARHGWSVEEVIGQAISDPA